jgi:glucokinase
MVYINIGSGIGGCLVLDGRLYNGQGFGAGEIGHTWIPVPGGGRDKLENCASGWSFQRRLAERYPFEAGHPLTRLTGGLRERIDGATAARAAQEGDAFVLEAFREEGEAVGTALANVITLLCPEVVAVGGGLSLAGELLLEPLRRTVDRSVIEAFCSAYRVVPAELGEDVVLSGALLLAAAAGGPD